MFPIKCYAGNCFHEEKSEVFSQWTSWTFKKNKQDSKIEINVYPTQLLILKCKLHLDFVITLAGGHCGLRGFFFYTMSKPNLADANLSNPYKAAQVGSGG